MPKTYRIEFTETQLRIIMAALDLKMRLNLGQLEELGFALRMHGSADLGFDPGAEKELLNQLKKLYFPDLHQNGSYGIRNKKVPKWDRKGYDMIQVMRKAIHDETVKELTSDLAIFPEGSEEREEIEKRLLFLKYTVSGHDYYGVADEEPPFTIEVVDD